MRRFVCASLIVGLMAFATPAAAYVGPGMGLGAIAVVLGILGSVVLAFVAILWFPLKRLFKKKRASAPTAKGADAVDAAQ